MRFCATLVFSLLAAGLASTAFADVFTQIDYPGAVSTIALGINNRDQIVGEYFDGSVYRPFLDSSGVFSTLSTPGLSPYVDAGYGINDSGVVVISTEGFGGYFGAAKAPG